MNSIKISEKTDNPSLNIALDTIKIGKQALVFVGTKRGAEKNAEEIAKRLKSTDVELENLSLDVLHLPKATKQCNRLSKCIKKGVAFHHAGLTSKQKEIIETNFKKGHVKIISCTPTLAWGVNLPAYRVIMRDLKRYGQHGLNFIPVLEAHQMFGRAGRPGYDTRGEAICIAATESDRDEIYNRYITGEAEDIHSKLAVEPALRTYLLSLIASDFVSSKEQIIDFFSKTFWAHQFEEMDKIEGMIERMLTMLEDWEFIKSGKTDDFQSADEIGNEKYKATLIGKRVSELYIDPLTANFIIDCLKKGGKISELSFLQMLSHTLEMRPTLRVKVKEYDKVQEALLQYGDSLLEKEPVMYDPDYEDFLSSVKTALMFKDWINEKDEEYLLEEYSVRPGELRVKLGIGDWLLYFCDEMSRMLALKNLGTELKKLRVRFKHGVREELIPLLKFRGVGRARGRKLFFNGIKDVSDVKKADISKLKQILGGKTAVDVKKQVGQEFKEVKVSRRKGQVSLKKFN